MPRPRFRSPLTPFAHLWGTHLLVLVVLAGCMVHSCAHAQTWELREGETIVLSDSPILPPRLEQRHRHGIVWTVLAGFTCYYLWAHERSAHRG